MAFHIQKDRKRHEGLHSEAKQLVSEGGEIYDEGFGEMYFEGYDEVDYGEYYGMVDDTLISASEKQHSQ
jgi:hypothetical protein